MGKKKVAGISGVVGLLLGIVGFGGYCLYEYLTADKVVDNSYKTQLKFETNSDSIARAVQFDVGQADCGLVQISKDNKFETEKDNFNILVDVGVENRSSNVVKKTLMKKIKDYNVKNIDLLVFSHLHFDHIGAASYLMTGEINFSFKNTVALFNWSEARYFGNKLSKTAKNLFRDLEKKKIKLADSNYWANEDNNKIVDFGNENYFSVVGGVGDPTDVKNQNAWSVVNRFQWNNESILYTGDLAGKPLKNGIVSTIPKKHYDQLDCDILKSPHHGSSTEYSNNLEFIQKVSPNQVWISAGDEDKYTLPDTSALINYKKVLKDVSLIKGTQKFGKTREEIKKDNPNVSKEEIDELVEKWKPLNDWVKNNPSVNNNNVGYGDIVWEGNK